MRLTHGESVIVGVYQGRSLNWHTIALEDAPNSGTSQYHIYDWRSEVLEPAFALPEGIGAVVRNHVHTYVRITPRRWVVSRDNLAQMSTVTNEEMLRFSGWEILSEGVEL